MEARRVLVELFPVNQCQFDEVIPGQVSLVKNVFNVFLQVFCPYRRKPANFVENPEPFVSVSVFFDGVQEVLNEKLGYLLGPSPYNEPLVKVVFKWNERCFRPDELVIVQNFINRDHRNQAAGNFVVESEWSYDVDQEVRVERKLIRQGC